MSQCSSNVVSIAGRRGGKARAALLARRDALIESNLDLVRSIARQVALSLPAAFELDDLIGTGNLGLLKAATNYDPRRHNGTPFSAYARPVIRGAILDSVRRKHYVENTRISCGNCAELPQPGDIPDREAELDHARAGERLAAAIAQLGAKHRAVVGWHYDEELRLPVIGARLSVGKSRASQLHMEAVRELRTQLAGV